MKILTNHCKKTSIVFENDLIKLLAN